uniref:Calponin-homology (CH) domain-containing protein n=1 Tax=Romanomermis culicivorax TaxID=13658 RepID=A0A915IGX3_ROMCU
MEVPEVSQSQEGQRQKLRIVLQYCQQVMAHPRWQQARWTAENIQKKDLCAILQLLVALAAHFRAPVRFPEHCQLQTLLVQKRDNQLYTRYVNEEITTSQDELGLKGEKDAFDTLYDHAPEKAVDVKNSLLAFVNKHLTRINLEAYDLEYSFQDGVYLVLLIGLLEGYFVPLYGYSQTPVGFEQKVQNVNLAYDLMQEAGLPKPKSRAEDIVNGDIKCTSRVLYGLFSKRVLRFLSNFGGEKSNILTV